MTVLEGGFSGARVVGISGQPRVVECVQGEQGALQPTDKCRPGRSVCSHAPVTDQGEEAFDQVNGLSLLGSGQRHVSILPVSRCGWA